MGIFYVDVGCRMDVCLAKNQVCTKTTRCLLRAAYLYICTFVHKHKCRSRQATAEDKNMTQKPKIVISSLDAQRLRTLLDSLDESNFIGIDELWEELNRADILEPEDMPSNVVTMNSTVRFREIHSKKEFSLTLVYPTTGEDSFSTLSILAPVGSALLGLKEGDTIEWPKPGGGQLSLEIIRVLYQPEREGELHR